MFDITRIVAVDDDKEHLDALVTGLHSSSFPCLGLHYQSVPTQTNIAPCPYVRIAFMDVNLLGLPQSSSPQNFGAIGDLLRNIAPKGPYLLVLWTTTPEDRAEVRRFLDERLNDTAKPFDVVAFDKADYGIAEGLVPDLPKLTQDIRGLTEDAPSLAVLTEWEEKVWSAAAETLSSITMLGSADKTGGEQQDDITKIMYAMAVEAVGQPNVAANPFRAVNEALLPVLADHVAASEIDDGSVNLWQQVVNNGNVGQSINDQEAALLNRVFHIASDIGANQGAERGAVIPLPRTMSGNLFEDTFGISEVSAAERLFRCRDFRVGGDQCRWVLVQVQAACDYAQRQPGPLPFFLGMEIIESSISNNSPPQALWRSPKFENDSSIRELQVNTRVQIPMSAAAARAYRPLYRLREQLLADLLHRAQTNNVRPGIISFSVRRR